MYKSTIIFIKLVKIMGYGITLRRDIDLIYGYVTLAHCSQKLLKFIIGNLLRERPWIN